MQFSSARPRAPSNSARFAPITPLPVPTAQDQCHYLRRSVGRHHVSQSERSNSNSDLDESVEDESSSLEGDDDEADADSPSSEQSDGTDSEQSDESTDAALSSRSASASSLYDSHNSSDSDDDANNNRIRIHDSSVTTSAMSVQRASQRNGFSWQSDNLGWLALLVPITGVLTMALTEILACANHFDCSKEYPTLSYAAEFKPEGHAFTLGMCATAIFILASIALFHWFLRLKLFHPNVDSTTMALTHGCLLAGAVAACSLFGLAVFDMGAHHDIHVVFTVVFFLSAWVMVVAVQAARRKVLQQDAAKPHRASAGHATSSSPWFALQRWKRVSLRDAYQLGRVFTYAGLSATGLFALLFLCVNGMWPNPLGFTAVQEALLEAFAIFCQLFFMGTLSCELSKLTRVVEHRDYEALERAE